MALLSACQPAATEGPVTGAPPPPPAARGPGGCLAPDVPLRPLIDAHVHLSPTPEGLERAAALFESVGVERWVAFNAGPPSRPSFWAHVEMARRYPGRHHFLANPDWRALAHPDFGPRLARQLRQAVAAGALGLKIFKGLGLTLPGPDGRLLALDDARLAPLWEEAARLGVPVAIHVGDPVAFFAPATPANERFAELSLMPDWSFAGPQYPRHEALMAQWERLLAAQPRTRFLGVHFGNWPERPDQVARWLERFSNLTINVAARLPEIGRAHPDDLAAIFRRFGDRISFGTDIVITPEHLQLGSVALRGVMEEPDAVAFYAAHRRFFEACASGIAHPTPVQGDWRVSALCLEEAALRRLYWDNAERELLSGPRPAGPP